MNHLMNEKTRMVKLCRWRFYSIVLLWVVLVLALIWRLMQLQVLPETQHGFKFLQYQGLARTLRNESIPAYRGVITDRRGEPLAVSTPVVSFWANPKELVLVPQQWPVLAKALGISLDALEDKIRRYRHKEFMYLQRHLVPERAEKIAALNVSGVYRQQEHKRFYPAAEITAHLVGFTNIDDKGQEGIELAYDQWLAGKSGRKQVLKDLSGRTIKDVALLENATSGMDIALSIDLRLQYLAYKELKTAVKTHAAKSASLVLLDVQTGEVLAMVNQPSYNPNDRRHLTTGALRNRAITDQFEPGSTMKPLTIMVALETGRYSPKTNIDTNPGYMRVNGKSVLDPVNYGMMDVTKVITKSSQVGIVKVGLDLEGRDIREMFFRLGLGQSPGTGFPGESLGLLPDYPSWQPIVQANLSFGYGLTLTALQLAQVYSVIADQGVKKPVSLLRLDNKPPMHSVVDAAITRQLIEMLKTVVQPGGTATRARLENYLAAGKTGTTHKVGKQGYADHRYTSLFAGFAPANKPRIVAVVVVHEPSRGQYQGGQVAAPVFARVVERSLQLLQIPPISTKKYKRPVSAISTAHKPLEPLT